LFHNLKQSLALTKLCKKRRIVEMAADAIDKVVEKIVLAKKILSSIG
jgi:putative cell wall-binding protein